MGFVDGILEEIIPNNYQTVGDVSFHFPVIMMSDVVSGIHYYTKSSSF